MSRSITHHIARRCARLSLGAMTPWPTLKNPTEGYSIILGVPWSLRHILNINLECISRCTLDRLVELHIVFDRPQKPGMAELSAQIIADWPSLPIRVQWHPRVAGNIAERINVSTFYNGMNIVTALRTCEAKAMILHDFDLYPLRADYFEKLASRVLDDGLRFAGLERTRFDGLTEDDNIYGTWGLAMDAQWLRNSKHPRDIFHRFARLPDGRGTMLDPFSWLQLNEPLRGGVDGMTSEDVCHVKNLCSTYLRTMDGKAPKVAWRIHYLLYLDSVSNRDEAMLEQAIIDMDKPESTDIHYRKMRVDCQGTHWTCGNVLDRELTQMDQKIFGSLRDITHRYLEASKSFFRRCDPDMKVDAQ